MVTRADVVNGALQVTSSRNYLEVGVNRGETFFAIQADRKVAVDPAFLFSVPDGKRDQPHCHFHEVTSDTYFSAIIDPAERFDVVYLDGLHTFEQTLRDFTNAIHHLNPDGIVVIDDVVPNSYQASLPDQLDAFKIKDFTNGTDNSWMGDTFKLVFFLRTFFPTWEVRTVSDNHGQAVVWRRGRANPAVPDLGAATIAGLQFIDVVRQLPVFQQMPFADIVALIRAGRGGDGVRPERTLSSLATTRTTLADPCELDLPCAAAFANAGEFDPAFGAHLDSQVYAARLARLDPVELVSLPETMIYPGSDYIATAASALIAEQISPLATPDARRVPAGLPVTTVGAQTVLVARYGAFTWGHWLGELLPKLALVEAAFPGRYAFAVPATYDEPRYETLRQSIAAYGVPGDRLVPLAPDRAYRMTNALAVTPVWSDRFLHPTAAARMRSVLQVQPGDATLRRIALVRPSGDARQLENWDEVAAVLTARGFEMVDPTALSFMEQVRLFGAAETVFATLGSGLASLIYAPEGVRVVSVATSVFGDWFFYALLQERKGTYADVRGAIRTEDAHIRHRSSFTVEPGRVEKALDVLQATARPPVVTLRYAAG